MHADGRGSQAVGHARKARRRFAGLRFAGLMDEGVSWAVRGNPTPSVLNEIEYVSASICFFG